MKAMGTHYYTTTTTTIERMLGFTIINQLWENIP
jgi:hypothetical protein